MYLSRLRFDPHVSHARRVLGDCRALHRQIMSGFPSLGEVADARARCGVLFRAEPAQGGEAIAVLVQSFTEPNWDLADLPARSIADPVRSLDPLFACIATGQVLTFRLRANPTRWTILSDRPEPNRTPHRVALVKEDEQIAWLARKGAAGGGFALHTVEVMHRDATGETGVVSVPDLRITDDPDVRWRSAPSAKEPNLTFGAVRYEGRLRVTDTDQFRETLRQGVGRGKAFGFGLLSVMPAR